jgi:HK97 gp10 family phage protein
MIQINEKFGGDVEQAIDNYVGGVKAQVLASAAASAALVIHDAARAAAPVSLQGHYFYGSSHKKTGQKYWFNAGTLRNSIYRVYSKRKSNADQVVYDVSWNHKKCPYGFMVEFGTVRAPAHPFMRKALAAMPKAIEAAKARMKARMSSVSK